MARNKVQFQKGLSEAQFAVLYGTEDQCREAVMRWRWPSGFVCPVCAGQHHSFVKTRALYQCTACRRQTSVIAGTIFAATKEILCRVAGILIGIASRSWLLSLGKRCPERCRCALGFAPCTTSLRARAASPALSWAAGLASPRPPPGRSSTS